MADPGAHGSNVLSSVPSHVLPGGAPSASSPLWVAASSRPVASLAGKGSVTAQSAPVLQAAAGKGLRRILSGSRLTSGGVGAFGVSSQIRAACRASPKSATEVNFSRHADWRASALDAPASAGLQPVRRSAGGGSAGGVPITRTQSCGRVPVSQGCGQFGRPRSMSPPAVDALVASGAADSRGVLGVAGTPTANATDVQNGLAVPVRRPRHCSPCTHAAELVATSSVRAATSSSPAPRARELATTASGTSTPSLADRAAARFVTAPGSSSACTDRRLQASVCDAAVVAEQALDLKAHAHSRALATTTLDTEGVEHVAACTLWAQHRTPAPAAPVCFVEQKGAVGPRSDMAPTSVAAAAATVPGVPAAADVAAGHNPAMAGSTMPSMAAKLPDVQPTKPTATVASAVPSLVRSAGSTGAAGAPLDAPAARAAEAPLARSFLAASNSARSSCTTMEPPSGLLEAASVGAAVRQLLLGLGRNSEGAGTSSLNTSGLDADEAQLAACSSGGARPCAETDGTPAERLADMLAAGHWYAFVEYMESRAEEVNAVLSEISSATRAQRAQLHAERRSLRRAELVARADCEEANARSERLAAEVASLREEGERLEQARLLSERRCERKDAELRDVLGEAAKREVLHKAEIDELAEQVRVLQDREEQRVARASSQDLSVSLPTRRRLFSSMADTSSSIGDISVEEIAASTLLATLPAAGQNDAELARTAMIEANTLRNQLERERRRSWLPECAAEATRSEVTLLGAEPNSETTSVARLPDVYGTAVHCDPAGNMQDVRDVSDSHGPLRSARRDVDEGMEPMATGAVQKRFLSAAPSQLGTASATSPESPIAILDAAPSGASSLSCERPPEGADCGRSTSPRHRADIEQPAGAAPYLQAEQGKPCRGCVAEKISAFEQRCQGLKPGSATLGVGGGGGVATAVADATRRGLRGAPVATPMQGRSHWG